MKHIIGVAFSVACCAAATQEAQAAPDTNEASRQAWARFTSSWNTCRNSAVIAVDIDGPAQQHVLPPRPASSHTVYIEAKGVKPDYRGAHLSPADLQNGIEWKGAFHFRSQTFREISIGKDGTRGQWSPWKDGTSLSSVHLTFRSGTWEIKEQQPAGIAALGRFARVRQPTCADVPS